MKYSNYNHTIDNNNITLSCIFSCEFIQHIVYIGSKKKDKYYYIKFA